MFSNQYFNNLKSVIDLIEFSQVDQCAQLICSYLGSSNKILICGNGGSATTASHYVTDWVKMSYVCKNKKLNAICLSDNIGALTAYANDISYDEVYSKQVEIYGVKGDLLVVISGSGNSKNVINAIKSAKRNSITTLGVLGYDGGKIKKLVDHCFHVRSFDMQICEDLHLVFGHIVMKTLTGETEEDRL